MLRFCATALGGTVSNVLMIAFPVPMFPLESTTLSVTVNGTPKFTHVILVESRYMVSMPQISAEALSTIAGVSVA